MTFSIPNDCTHRPTPPSSFPPWLPPYSTLTHCGGGGQAPGKAAWARAGPPTWGWVPRGPPPAAGPMLAPAFAGVGVPNWPGQAVPPKAVSAMELACLAGLEAAVERTRQSAATAEAVAKRCQSDMDKAVFSFRKQQPIRKTFYVIQISYATRRNVTFSVSEVVCFAVII